MTKSRGILAPRHRWTEAEIELLLATYPDQTAQAVAAQLWPGCVPHHVHTKAKKLGLKKSEAFLASAASGRLDGVRGAATRFQPGHRPVAGGTAAMIEAGIPTRFAPGQHPSNHRPVGSLRVASIGYLQIKLTDTGYPPRDWVMYHRHVWEQAHGPIPEGHMVVFKRGRFSTNPEEITPEWLECISKQEHMLRHTVHQYGPDIAEVVRLRGAITSQIRKRTKALEQS